MRLDYVQLQVISFFFVGFIIYLLISASLQEQADDVIEGGILKRSQDSRQKSLLIYVVLEWKETSPLSVSWS